MKKTIYLIRHGQTIFNYKNKMQGFCDSPLTDLGIKQAQLAGKWFRENNVDKCTGYTSSLNRTKQTFYNAFNNTNFTSLEGLNEWNFGTAEGDDVALHISNWPFENYFLQFSGESKLQFNNRIIKTMNDIVSQDNSSNIIVVAHGMVLKAFGESNMPSKYVKSIDKIDNCTIFKFEYETDKKLWAFVDAIYHDFDNLK